MPHEHDTVDRTHDNPIAIGRAIIIGSVAGAIASFAYFNANGDRFNDTAWNRGEGRAQFDSSAGSTDYRARPPDVQEPVDPNEPRDAAAPAEKEPDRPSGGRYYTDPQDSRSEPAP